MKKESDSCNVPHKNLKESDKLIFIRKKDGEIAFVRVKLIK